MWHTLRIPPRFLYITNQPTSIISNESPYSLPIFATAHVKIQFKICNKIFIFFSYSIELTFNYWIHHWACHWKIQLFITDAVIINQNPTCLSIIEWTWLSSGFPTISITMRNCSLTFQLSFWGKTFILALYVDDAKFIQWSHERDLIT